MRRVSEIDQTAQDAFREIEMKEGKSITENQR